MKPTTKAHRFEALRTFAAELTVPPRPKRAVALSSHQRAAIQEFLDAALAENTRKAYAYYWRHFTAWCQTQGYGALPAEPVLVAAFLAELAAPPDGAKGASVSTITIALSAIRYAHAKAAPDTPNPAGAPSVKTVMAGIRRKLRDRKPSRKHPMTRDRLERLLSTLPDDTVSGVRDRALVLLCFALALRSSEAVSLNVSHVTIDRAGATISLPYSKTDQAGEGETYRIKRRPRGDALCVVVALERWLKYIQEVDRWRRTRDTLLSRRATVRHPDISLFRALNVIGGPTSRRLDAESVGYILKGLVRQAREAGVWDPKVDGRLSDYGSHSLRAGFVTTAYEKNMPEWQIQKVTRHKSTAVLRSYNRQQGVDKTAAIDEVLDE